MLLQEAQTTVTNYTAPAPSNRGTILAISLLIGLTAVAVDAIGVTYRSPALAGIPLLSAFLASATNSGDGLGAWYAVPGALAWLALVGRQGVRSLRAWGTASPHSSSGPLADPTTAFATLGRVVGVGALGVAIVLPGLIPHFPTTFLADGLGRSANGRGGSGSDVRLASSIDIARDLGNRSTDPVFRYRSTSDRLEPLRVGILDIYRRGQWQSSSDFTFVPVDGQIPGPIAGPEVPRRVERISVVDNAIGVPQVALPPGAVGTPFPAGTWNMTVQGLVQLTAPATSYSTEFVELDPEDGQFSADLDNPQVEGNDARGRPGAPRPRCAPCSTRSPTTATRRCRSPARCRPTCAARTFTYSLELADQAADGNLSDEPLARFLETKRGYCVQFTSAMVMLSRAAGIPARMAVGFLPGSIDGDDRVVRVSDAHAWPELYFPRLGWVRFEPTPGTRSGVAPEYSIGAARRRVLLERQPDHLARRRRRPPLDRAVARRDRRPDRHHRPAPPAPVPCGSSTRHVTTILVVLLALLIAAIVPFGAWLSRRRARAAARDDADRVEAEWQSLLLRLQDIGFVPPDGATPRQASRQIGHDAYLTPDENDALGRVVTHPRAGPLRPPRRRPGRRHRRRPHRLARGPVPAPPHRPGAGAAAARGGQADVARARAARCCSGATGAPTSRRTTDRPPSPSSAEVLALATTSALMSGSSVSQGAGRAVALGHLHAGRAVAERLVQPAGRHVEPEDAEPRCAHRARSRSPRRAASPRDPGPVRDGPRRRDVPHPPGAGSSPSAGPIHR